MAIRTTQLLVLVRHGKAQPNTEGTSDELRELTPAGRRALAAWLPRTLEPLGKDARKAQVWTSPALRARQTADEVTRALKPRALSVHDCLWEQDADAFFRELAACPSPCVVAVGHTPFVENVLEQLTGNRLVFSTGAAAAVELEWPTPDEVDESGGDAAPVGEDAAPQDAPLDSTDAAPNGSAASASEDAAPDTPNRPTGRLLWFAQGPRSKRWDTLYSLEAVLARAEANVEARLAAFLDDPADVETMHKFRISIRTLRSLAAFCAPFQKKKQAKAIQDDLRAIVLKTSYLRELDVLSKQVGALGNAAPDLVESCARQRAEECERVFAALQDPAVRRGLDRVRANIENIHWKKRVERNGLAPERLHEHFAQLVADLEDGLATTNLTDAEATHKLRKNAKRVRYDADNLAKLVGEGAQDASRAAHDAQDRLGELCDARVNLRIVGDFPAEGLSEAALQNLATLKEYNERCIASHLEAQTASEPVHDGD